MTEPSSLLHETIAHHRIVEKLDGCDMSVVCNAQDNCLRRFVARKFLTDNVRSNPQALARFEPKAQATSAFDQPLFRRTTALRCPRVYAR
jgi:hypothetical protein